jgi:hypothetical protein
LMRQELADAEPGKHHLPPRPVGLLQQTGRPRPGRGPLRRRRGPVPPIPPGPPGAGRRRTRQHHLPPRPVGLLRTAGRLGRARRPRRRGGSVDVEGA